MAFTYQHGDRPIRGYQVIRGLGRGGFGEVYHAVSDGGRQVALKYLHSNQEIELRGVSHCINLKSPYLVSIFDVIRSDAGEYFVVMEYVSGPSLRDLLAAQPQGLGADKTAFFLKGLARGLGYLHDRGIVHRDLKPGNVFYEDGYVKIGDYGLSKFISNSAAGGNTISVGTVHYMAPEVGSGNYSKTIDIYALGVILYEMLMGKVPFEGQSAGEVLMKHLIDQPEVDQLPGPYAQVIRKALAKDPNDRYQGVGQMLDEVLGQDRLRESIAGFDGESLATLAARVARNVRTDAPPTLPIATAPDRRSFDGSSAGRSPRSSPDIVDATDRRHQDVAGPRVRFAGFWVRFLALAIDMLVLSIPIVVLARVTPLRFMIPFLYHVLLLTYWQGQTLGKKACGIRVVDPYGLPPTIGRVLARELSRFLSTLAVLVGYIIAGFTERKQALHDLIASTYVIYTDPVVSVPEWQRPVNRPAARHQQQRTHAEV